MRRLIALLIMICASWMIGASFAQTVHRCEINSDRGDELFKKEDYENAKVFYRNVILKVSDCPQSCKDYCESQILECDRRIAQSTKEYKYQNALKDYLNNLFDSAFIRFKSLAETNYLRSCYYLGVLYEEGKGTGMPPNVEEAVRYYKQSSDSSAQFRLGQIYEIGIPPYGANPAIAFNWYLKAADQNMPRAQLKVGKMYRMGEGMPKPMPLEAISRFTKIESLPEAQFQLGEIYWNGEDGKPSKIEKPFSRAVDYYEKAATKGHIKAAYKLGEIFEEGRQEEGIEKNEERAIKWYKVAADSVAQAKMRLGALYKKLKKYEDARVWFNKAAELGTPEEQREIATELNNGVFGDTKYEDSIKWYKSASDKGDLKATYLLILLYKEQIRNSRYNGIISDLKHKLADAQKQGNKQADNYLEDLTERDREIRE